MLNYQKYLEITLDAKSIVFSEAQWLRQMQTARDYSKTHLTLTELELNVLELYRICWFNPSNDTDIDLIELIQEFELSTTSNKTGGSITISEDEVSTIITYVLDRTTNEIKEIFALDSGEDDTYSIF